MQSAECKVQSCRGEHCSSDDTSSTASGPPSPTRFAGEGNLQNSPSDETSPYREEACSGEDCSSECKMPSDDDATEATAEVVKSDTKAHLTSSVPRSARAPIGVLTKSEIGELRNIFANLSDTEIQKLYKRVTKQN